MIAPKTLVNTDADGAEKNVPDIGKFGDPDRWQLICKAWSKSEDWMKSTKAMEIQGLGVLVQVSTQQGHNVAEALTFLPGARIEHQMVEHGEAGTLERVIVADTDMGAT